MDEGWMMAIKESLNGKVWTASDEMAAEDEVREFLAALVRLVKPKVVIETGCYWGGVSIAIATSLVRNGVDGNIGMLHTCDVDTVLIDKLRERQWELGSHEKWIRFYRMPGVKMIRMLDESIDFAFLDSGGDRLEEAKALLPRLSPGAYVCIHDARRPKETEAAEWLMMNSKMCNMLTFETPRGLAVIQVWP